MQPSTSAQGHALPLSASGAGAAGEPIQCNGCKQGLEDSPDNTVVSFGTSFFHVDCRCAKCSKHVEHNMSLLLLADGNPVCENCKYICSACSNPIHNEAIVTGDESYHSECFRCRSCQNKIEELIFAKTNQGIWCMACHNERVARTRKHAEAKRNRQARKDKEAASAGGSVSAPRPSRSRAERPPDADRTLELPDLPGVDPSTGAPLPQVRPLPPSPSPAASGSYGRAPSLDGGRHHPSSSAMPLPPSASSQSIGALSRSSSPLHPPPLAHSRSSSQLSLDGSAGGEPRRTSASALRNEINNNNGGGGAGGARRSSGEHAEQPRDFSPYPMPESPMPPQTPVPAAHADVGAGAGRQGSLAAPAVSKSERRRSGFYGANARPSLGEETLAAQLGGVPEAAAALEQVYAPSTTPPPPAHDANDLHASMSFYDPDTLLFLNHVGGSAPGSPRLAPPAGGKALPDLTLTLDGEAIERLGTPSPAPSGGADGEDESGDDGAPGGGGGGVARRVRESIRLQRRESEGRAGGSASLSTAGLDVELVEMLLTELEATKREMKDVKSKYNAFRRASRSAFEGFSMAREEYDKEVAARREAEHQMQILRAKFIEQARRLAQVDQEQKTAETLKRQSKDLRTSVVGMEKHLSQLKAEVALSTAQVAELAALGKDEGAAPDRTSSSTAHDEVAEALNARLETVKDVHRDEINALVAQRDDLSRQVAELKQARDAHLEEATDLAARNASLAEKNTEAARQLDSLHESLSKLSLLSSKTPSSSATRNGHTHSPSSSSLLSTLPSGARSPLATARYISSPGEGEAMHRFAKPEVVEASSRNKFWGKSKAKGSSSGDAARANQQLPPPPPPGSKSPVVQMRAGSIDSTGVRQHAFQQTSILRPVRCDYCGDKMWGLNEMRCTACGSYAHAKCAGYLQHSCNPGGSASASSQVDDVLSWVPTGPLMFGGDLESQAQKENVEVPTVVEKCIEAVEAYGMSYEGIYRKTGGMGQTKLITQYFERGLEFDLQDRDKFNDIAAVTSCMKNYFRSLRVPLTTHDLHEEFVSAAELPEGEERLKAIERVLYKLPPVHFHTARLLFQHLNRVKSLSAENKMTSANLGVVFGPTVLRSPIAAREWSDMGPKAKLVEILCDHAETLFAKPFPAA
ncbi:Rho-type gtpase-activating protein [Rhodotorula kratochvilovae]